MPLKATLTADEFGELPEVLHEDYTKQDDGSYNLNLLSDYTPNDKVEDVTGLKSALGKERENAKTASSELRKLREQFGDIDPEKYQELLEREAQAEEEKAKKAGEWDKLRGQMTDKHNEELQKRAKREEQLIEVIKKSTIDAAVIAALNEVGGNVSLLLPHVKDRMQLVEEDGQFSARVIDEAGTVRVNGEGTFLTAKELVSEMRDQESFAAAFKADVKSGGGTPPGDGNGSGDGKKAVNAGDLKRSAMTPRQKVDFINEHGNAEFEKLPWS
jgi:hypothetical protein